MDGTAIAIVLLVICGGSLAADYLVALWEWIQQKRKERR
jgi:hypothetical protein